MEDKGCPWKVTARAVGRTKIVQVHIFRNEHNHSLEDVSISEPVVRCNRATAMIDDVIRSNPDYLPRQICKDFRRQYGMQLNYCQAWNLKEKAKERIHVSIHGFQLGPRPIILIDSSHMSGPYKGALFSASSYDADDGMFPLAYDLFSSENYEDWLWFLEKLKMVIGERDVIIISDRHQGIIRSVSELNTKERKGKENALQMLDSIAYASSMKVSNGKAFLEVDLMERTCTCKAWQMSGIPCDHACAAIRRMGFDVFDYVDD
ncbi:hypothetical protein CK203_026574 [Vitis vinifera]|uniref:SWIM-type domain-containing protein n=1 Tax=Vitis vinifera TaxID=29760 RepID=A0A438ITU6_VITVI|nr:hypothetical protein CK203_026574 [Vitis vinifera]